MNSEKSKIATSTSTSRIRAQRTVTLCATLAAVVITVACSNHPKANANAADSEAGPRPVVLKTVATTLPQPGAANVLKQTDLSAKPPVSKSVSYKSRDYGVSFDYPRQYAYLSAKTIAKGDAALQPKPDGTNTQFTLASVEIPKGFYPDSDLDRAYFTLSLNEDLSEDECQATLGSPKDAKQQTQNINGMDFRWVETDKGGSGESVKTRNYVTYTNATCYQLEVGVKSKNEKGLAREVNPDQVFKRLDAIVETVKINPTLEPAKGSVQESAGK
jgi:hypothetical protein